jgi:EmrB/QacA subfamily drug resistance transporter
MSTANQRWLALGLLCAAQFMVVLDATIVLIALPSIGAALHFAPQDLSWVITAYTLFFGGFLLLGGRAADLFGRRLLFRLGLGLFSVGSLLCALAPSSGLLVVARAGQGLGAALLSPAALAILTMLFKEGHERNQALGIWGGLGAVGAAAGLILSGILTTWFGWQSIFIVNVPIGLVAFFAATRLLPQNEVTGTLKGFDLPGAVTLTAGLVLLVYAAVGVSANGLFSAATLSVAGLAGLLLLTFIVIESRIANPLVRLSIFRLRQLSTANAINLLFNAAQGAMFFLLTLYTQNVLHYTPLASGVSSVPTALGIMVMSNVASRLITQRGIKPVLIVGIITFGLGIALLLRLPVDGLYWRDILPTYLIISVGMGCAGVAVTVCAFVAVPASEVGLASGLINTSGQIGGAIGVAILGTVAAAQMQSTLGAAAADAATLLAAQVDGYRLAFGVSLGLMVIALVLAVVNVSGKPLKAHPAVLSSDLMTESITTNVMEV